MSQELRTTNSGTGTWFCSACENLVPYNKTHDCPNPERWWEIHNAEMKAEAERFDYSWKPEITSLMGEGWIFQWLNMKVEWWTCRPLCLLVCFGNVNIHECYPPIYKGFNLGFGWWRY